MASKNVKRSTPGRQAARPRLHPSAGADQLRAYYVLYRLNRAFELIRLNLDRLKELGFRRLFLDEFHAMAGELHAEANFKLTAELNFREQEYWRRFGLLVREREKRLRDPNDILLKADRMRREQEQQQKPTTRKPKRP